MPARKIADILQSKERIFSYELFPPKTAKGLEALYANVEKLSELQPDYVSVTYGAGGSTSKSTRDIINALQNRFGLTCMHHLTLINQTKDVLTEIILQLKADGIRNILALRGDPPAGEEEFIPVAGGLRYCYELIDLIRSVGGDYFNIGVAGFPEVHPNTPTRELDIAYLKEKVEHAAEFVITQFFFDNASYSDYLERAAKADINIKIIPGVLPITNFTKLLEFADRCGAYIGKDIHDIFGPLAHDPEQTARQGVDYAIKQCEDLLRRGAPGIHFYALNQVEPVRTIWKRLSEKV